MNYGEEVFRAARRSQWHHPEKNGSQYEGDE